MEKVSFKEYFKERRTHKIFMVIVIAYLLLCISSAIYWCIDFQARNLFMSLVFSLIAPLVFCVEYIFKFRFGELFTSLMLFLAFGAILGSCFNVYTTLPSFDTLLHGLSGIIFACLGFSFAEKFFGKADSPKTFWGCLIFSICFSLSIALIWEIFEYVCTSFFGLDMMEDAYVSNINSYLLSGSHTETVELDGIVKTMIFYGDNQVYTINGYLDLGLIDTLTDMIVCFIGTLIFFGTTIFSYYKAPKLNTIFIPQTKHDK